ncbi:MAG: toll/interleukin-1 receptor domain-containing protein [Pseudomonadota bacterium]
MGEYKYRAFISYSHADERWGGWLHRALESYRTPKGLVGKATDAGPVPKRLTPIFRDREDLPAAGNLNDKIQGALADSQFQIVICSPRSAQSKWVNEEIKLFKKLHGEERTLAIIVDGEPGASAMPGREQEECFPPALRFLVDENGDVTNTPSEPVAADARAQGDGKQNALSKLIAGLLGVGLDDLVQREATRKAKRARVIAGGSTGLAGIMAVLTVMAINARNEASQMRGEAENLIEFMLTDLRKKLEPVGRLDALDSVGERALTYYETQPERKLDDEALARRTRALLLVGQIDQQRNDYGAASAAYEAAAAASAELLRRDPNNPDRIFDHAQSVFYVGDVAREGGFLDKGEEYYREYARLADELMAIDPDRVRARMERAYAYANLGILKFELGDYPAAVEFFKQSVDVRRSLHEENPENRGIAYEYAHLLSWLAFAEIKRGEYRNALAILESQIELYDSAFSDAADDFRILTNRMIAQRRLGRSYLQLGEIENAERENEIAVSIAEQLVQRDPENARWKGAAVHPWIVRSQIAFIQGDQPRAAKAAKQALTYAQETISEYQYNVRAQNNVILALTHSLTVQYTLETLERLANEHTRETAERNRDYIETAALAAWQLAHTYSQNSDPIEAQRIADEAIDWLDEQRGTLGVRPLLHLALLHEYFGETSETRKIIEILDKTDLAHPIFIALKARQKRET